MLLQDWSIPSPKSHDDWERFLVTGKGKHHVFKNGKVEDLGNYRPVSLTSFLRKMMEQVFRIPVEAHEG